MESMALFSGLLEGFAEREPDGAADGIEVARGEGDRSDTGRILNGLASVEEIEHLEDNAHVVRLGLVVRGR
jgi:hypothetical protein